MKYKQLTSQQRSQIFALLQRNTPRKYIALIVGCSQSTLSRELKRNSTEKGHHDRPSEANGKRFGDFEMDLVVDGFGHAILVMVERLTNFVMMEKLPEGKKAEPIARTVVRMLYGYRKYIKTITTDNGSEFAAHLDITAGLRMRGMDDVIVYFADSYCSWQKGAVEHENKLIRQYIPKKANFKDFSEQFVRNVGRKLNLRPRKKLGFSTPKEEFYKHIT